MEARIKNSSDLRFAPLWSTPYRPPHLYTSSQGPRLLRLEDSLEADILPPDRWAMRTGDVSVIRLGPRSLSIYLVLGDAATPPPWPTMSLSADACPDKSLVP